MSDKNSLKNLCAHIAEQQLPRWSALPDLELYMDQVLSLIDRYLGTYPGFDRKGLTASMVNNYVKLGVMPPPSKKKYTRSHLAQLIMICILKTSLPIDSIKKLLNASVESAELCDIYNMFCEYFETSVKNAADAAANDLETSGIYCAALRAQAEQAVARELYTAAFEEERKE